VFGVSFNTWQRYQWQQWSQQVNPIFHRLIQDNQGRITPLDLAMKANFSATTARRYLESKAEEFGAQRQEYQDVGTVYYFITSSTLGRMLDQSEPPKEDPQVEQKEFEPQVEPTKDVVASVTEQKVDSTTQEQPKDVVAQVTEQKADSTTQEQPVAAIIAPEGETASDLDPTSSTLEIAQATLEQELTSHTPSLPKSLIQSELAKRLNVYSSTVYKRRDDADFSEWSRSRDPDGIAWEFSPKTKEFHPVE
jgi:hypothetical protein